MKQPIILLALCFLFFSHLAKAQTNFGETYKKTRAFTSSNLDSALILATKCIKLAKTPSQKHMSYYLLGFSAKELCLFGLAKNNYKTALGFATDSLSCHRTNIALANTFLSAGNLNQALALIQKSIDYNLKNKLWSQLTYAYDVKAWVLQKKNEYSALFVSRKALRLKHKHAPKEIGYGYKNLAEIFAAFNVYDSAIVYQQKALKHYPIQTPEQIACLNIQLAKYHILNNQPTLATSYLQELKQLKKRPLTEAIACHTQALYYSKTGQQSTALAEFTRCDSLLETLLKQAPDVITRQTIAECAKQLYEDALKLDDLPSIVRVRYEGKLQTAYVRLTSYHNQLQLLDQAQQQRLNNSYTFQKFAPTTQQWPWYWWAGAGVLLGAILLYVGWLIHRHMVALKNQRKADKKVADLSPTEQQALQNQRMIEFVAEKIAQKNQALQAQDASSSRKPKEVTTEDREIFRMFYQQFTYQQIGDELNINPLTVKSKAQRLARYIGYSSPTQLLQAFDPGWPPAKDNSAKK